MRKLAIPLVLTVILSFPAVWLVRSIDWLAAPASVEASTTDRLILLTFDIATVIFVLCTVFLVYSLVVFRRKPGETGEGQHFHGNTTLEIAWTVVPTIIVLALWWLGVEEMNRVDLGSVMAGEMPDGALHVKVTGQQWSWSFEYPGQAENTAFGEIQSGELVMPVDRPVFFDIETTDVIHSFWVPEMRFKMDAIPGATKHVVYTPTEPGEYRVRCAELCGSDHATMYAPVRVVSQAEFDQFIVDNDVSSLTPAERGKRWSEVYGCIACHSADGTTEGKVGPSWQDIWNNERDFVDADSVVADEAYIENSILAPGDRIIEGYQNVMPANFTDRFTEDFGDTEQPIGDLIEYIKSLDTDG